MEIESDDAAVKNKDELLQDEMVLTSALRSMKLHAKAKLLIFTELEKIEVEREKANKGGRDMDDIEIDFMKLQDNMFALLK